MSDSIVMAEEIVAAWSRDNTLGFLWKVDFSKAYDSIDWSFLWNVLRRRGFPETCIRWVKQCVTAIGVCDAGFFLARIPSGGGKRDGVGEMGDRLSSGLSRRGGSLVFATYQLGVIDPVGRPPAPAVRGSIVGATP